MLRITGQTLRRSRVSPECCKSVRASRSSLLDYSLNFQFDAGRRTPPGGVVLFLFHRPMLGNWQAGKNSEKELRIKPSSADGLKPRLQMAAIARKLLEVTLRFGA